MRRKYFIRTFGCAANEADSERIAAYLKNQGYQRVKEINEADYIVINTCMVREMAENRVYGLINNLNKLKINNNKLKIILTGCMVGMAFKEKSGKFFRLIKKKLPQVDEYLPIEEIGFDYAPLRSDKNHALVPISNGCNNFCTYCVVPYTRGREISRPYQDIIGECVRLTKEDCKQITLLGQNVNSYGADIINSKVPAQGWSFSGGKIQKLNNLKPIYVKHLGRHRIPTLFPYLLEEVAKLGFEKVDFISSNPWDFSDELIEVVKNNPNITREIHLPVQSGSDTVLKRMNRWYTAEQYLTLISKLKNQIPHVKISTDIIVGFCSETEEEFQETVDLCRKVNFCKAYIAVYSDRPLTVAHKTWRDDIPHKVKKERWKILEEMINKPNLSRRNR